MPMEINRMKEIPAEDLHPEEFIQQKVDEISGIVGDGLAINALSGGVRWQGC